MSTELGISIPSGKEWQENQSLHVRGNTNHIFQDLFSLALRHVSGLITSCSANILPLSTTQVLKRYKQMDQMLEFHQFTLLQIRHVMRACSGDRPSFWIQLESTRTIIWLDFRIYITLWKGECILLFNRYTATSRVSRLCSILEDQPTIIGLEGSVLLRVSDHIDTFGSIKLACLIE